LLLLIKHVFVRVWVFVVVVFVRAGVFLEARVRVVKPERVVVRDGKLREL
jgi:hypothetical protein